MWHHKKMPANTLNELRRQCLDATEANQVMLRKLASSSSIDGMLKLEMSGRILDTSEDFAVLADMIEKFPASSANA